MNSDGENIIKKSYNRGITYAENPTRYGYRSEHSERTLPLWIYTGSGRCKTESQRYPDHQKHLRQAGDQPYEH